MACQHDHRLVGTAASVLHGVDSAANDVDFLFRDREDVDAFHASMTALTCLKAPAFLAEDGQHLAVYIHAGTEIELSTVEWSTESDTIECM